jgi:hypothetical protein
VGYNARGTRAELKKIMMTERHHMRCSAAHPSLFMTGYATDLSQQCKIFFFICGRVPSVMWNSNLKKKLVPVLESSGIVVFEKKLESAEFFGAFGIFPHTRSF